MSNRNMNVSVLVSLVDRMTGPLQRLRAGLDRLSEAGRRVGVIGAVAAGISFAAPLQAAAQFDGILRDVSITAGKTGADVEKLIASQAVAYQKLALQVGQKSADIASAAQILVSAGMDSALIERLMPVIGKVATAANAALSDTAKTAFSLADALKIPADQMELAMAKLVTAGKLGRFEFKNMASEFPELTAQVAKLGVTGMEAVDFLGAALQTAMRGTNNPATAANNLKNFLSKISSPETIKNFKDEMNTDIVGVMTNATARGLNPIEAVLEKLSSKLAVPQKEIDAILKKAKATGMTDKQAAEALRGRLQQLLQGSKLGSIFADMQVQDFLIPFMLNKAGFKADKNAIRGANTQVIDDDFASRMRSLQEDIKRFGEVGTQAMRRIGLAFASNLPLLNSGMAALLRGVADLDARFPGLIDKVVSFGGVALLAGAALAILTPVFSALAAAIGLLFSPIMLVSVAITGVVAAIYTFRQEIFAAMIQAGQSAADGASKITAALSGLGVALMQVGSQAMQGLWDGMQAKFNELISWVTRIPSLIVAAIGNIDLSNIIKWPSLPSWLGGGGAPGSTGGSSTGPNIPTPGQGGFSTTPGQTGVIGGTGGFAPRDQRASAETKVGGRIVVSAAPGSSLREVTSDNPSVQLTPERGAMLGRA